MTTHTEQKHLEEALDTMKDHYLDLYENAPVMFAGVDVKTRKILHCNQELVRALGHTKKQEIIGRPVLDIYHPDCAEDVRRAIRTFMRTGRLRDVELQLQRKDGSAIDVSLSTSAIRDAHGNIVSSRSILQDITKRKRMEDRLREMALFPKLNPGPTLRFNRSGVVTAVNPAARVVIGGAARPGALLKTLLPALAHLDVTQCIAEARTVVRQIQLSQRHWQLTMVCEADHGFGYIYFADITKQKQAEAVIKQQRNAAARERDKANSILQGIGDGVFVIDQDGLVTVFNRTAATISGFTPEEVIGQRYDTVLKFMLEEEEQPNDQFIELCLETGKSQVMSNHTVLVRKDGSRVPVADSVASLKDEQGRVVGCVVVFRNISQERAIEQSKSEFVSLASHQLRTPPATIKWYAELLLKGRGGRLTTKQKHYVMELAKVNRRMIELVTTLLDVSRIELGELPIESAPTDVRALADKVVADFSHDIEAKSITLEKRLDGRLSPINVDSRLLSVVLDNLVSNAIKYSDQNGKVALHMKKSQGNLFIKVIDNGFGIAPDQQEKIFTMLFRTEEAIKRDVSGTGLGLYLVKSIVDRLEGKIWFESEEGKQTTFYVTVPLDKPAAGSHSGG